MQLIAVEIDNDKHIIVLINVSNSSFQAQIHLTTFYSVGWCIKGAISPFRVLKPLLSKIMIEKVRT